MSLRSDVIHMERAQLSIHRAELRLEALEAKMPLHRMPARLFRRHKRHFADFYRQRDAAERRLVRWLTPDHCEIYARRNPLQMIIGGQML